MIKVVNGKQRDRDAAAGLREIGVPGDGVSRVASSFGIAGLLGWPVAHSRSPVIHNHWLAQHGIAGRYVLFPVPPEKLEAAIRGPLGARHARLQRHHAAQAGDLSAARSRRRACAPHRRREYGRRRAGRLAHAASTTTATASSRACATPTLRGSPTAGRSRAGRRRGRARGRGKSGRSGCDARSASPIARSPRRSEIADAFGSAVNVVPWEQREEALDDVALLANATSLGMAGKPPLDLSLDRLPTSARRRSHLRCRRRPRSWPPRVRAATSPSTGSACCSTRRGRRSTRGSA